MDFSKLPAFRVKWYCFFQVVYPPANHLPRGSIPVEKKPVVKTGCLLMRSFG